MPDRVKLGVVAEAFVRIGLKSTQSLNLNTSPEIGLV